MGITKVITVITWGTIDKPPMVVYARITGTAPPK